MSSFIQPSFKMATTTLNYTKFSWRQVSLGLTLRPFSLLVLFFIPSIAFADGETPVSEGLGYVLNAMYGETGITLATLAIMVVGLLCLNHRLEWKWLVVTISGIAIIFGAPAIVKGIVSLIH